MSRSTHPWYSFRGGSYPGNAPSFYDGSAFAWVAETESRFPGLMEAAKGFIGSFEERSAPYFNANLVSKKGSWRQGTFYFWGLKNEELCRAVPAIDDFIWSVPGMLSGGLSLLKAETDILPHFGDTDAVMRCHLGLVIPAPLPECGLEVNGEQRSWEKGKWLLFCDAHYHRAWNHTKQTRIVLIVDVLRPGYESRKREICSNVRSMLSLQRLEQAFPLFRKFPGKIRGLVRRFFFRIHYFRFKNEY
ncbi:MAG TPA: aspartyl/asparaginyl beta-hydroxylase domain-containing protein [Bacteroidia bacterium]|nr:aspartyl/asparaginyl beta-hydroxylase domain-containing protein [Bacteroidia bacterium]